MTPVVPQLCLERCEWLPLHQLDHKTILITGATGLVGRALIAALLPLCPRYSLRILALVRDLNKARECFADAGDHLCFLLGDIRTPLAVDGPVDYIIHGAAVTSSQSFMEKPVDTVLTAVDGTRNILELAREKKVCSVVYLSSMEVYGTPRQNTPLCESQLGDLDPLSLRSGYPESKRLCENLCVAYASQYGVPVTIARLAQTFGPGIPAGDRRVLIQFMESAQKNRDIEIKTSGNSSRMYLYTFDCACALITLLLKGQPATAYNVADKRSYCSIVALADLVIRITGSSSAVRTNTGSAEETAMYPPDSFLCLDTTRLEQLGWRPLVTMEEGLLSLAQALQRP